MIVVFAFFGQGILRYMHISIPALQGAGGLLLLLIALELLTGNEKEPSASQDVNIALVPLGTPLLAGPGAIVAVMLFVQRVDSVGTFTAVALGIVLMHLTLWLAMRFSVNILQGDPRERGAAGDPDRRPAAVRDRRTDGRRRGARVRRRRGLSRYLRPMPWARCSSDGRDGARQPGDRLVALAGDRHRLALVEVLEALADQPLDVQPQEGRRAAAADVHPLVELGLREARAERHHRSPRGRRTPGAPTR